MICRERWIGRGHGGFCCDGTKEDPLSFPKSISASLMQLAGEEVGGKAKVEIGLQNPG